jgi:hypothetical protein
MDGYLDGREHTYEEQTPAQKLAHLGVTYRERVAWGGLEGSEEPGW